ncbi:MAG: aldolase [Minwuia sp.]|uniref:aldolase n=1 Tax=Minwuia sp. TaxID=2493630 RepID=UPI003A8A0054
MDEALREQRIDLACAFRWAVRLNLHEGVCNHFSLAVPDEDGVMRGNRFLINPYGRHWSEMTASSLLLVDADGDVLEGEEEVETSAFTIHRGVHLAAPQAVCVMHTHMPHTTALTLLKDSELKMCEQNALMFHDRIAYDEEYNGLSTDNAEGERIASKLGNRAVLMMASHGVTVTGANVRETFTDLYYLERAATFQVLARSTGGELRELSGDVVSKTSAQMTEERPILAERHFAALRRILEREEPAFLN